MARGRARERGKRVECGVRTCHMEWAANSFFLERSTSKACQPGCRVAWTCFESHTAPFERHCQSQSGEMRDVEMGFGCSRTKDASCAERERAQTLTVLQAAWLEYRTPTSIAQAKQIRWHCAGKASQSALCKDKESAPGSRVEVVHFDEEFVHQPQRLLLDQLPAPARSSLARACAETRSQDWQHSRRKQQHSQLSSVAHDAGGCSCMRQRNSAFVGGHVAKELCLCRRSRASDSQPLSDQGERDT